MSEQFQLVFRGECLEGYQQHEVMIELEQRLGLSADQVEALFGPRAVVIKRAVSRDEAARFQALFRSAGARLRVLAASAPVAQSPPAEDDERPQGVAASDDDREAPAASDPFHGGASSGFDAPDFDLAPAGSELPQQPPPEPPEVDVSGLTLAEPGAELETVPKRPVPVPDLSHLQLEPTDQDQPS